MVEMLIAELTLIHLKVALAVLILELHLAYVLLGVCVPVLAQSYRIELSL